MAIEIAHAVMLDPVKSYCEVVARHPLALRPVSIDAGMFAACSVDKAVRY
jgi:hypothetical protein